MQHLSEDALSRFRPISIAAKCLHRSSCHLVWR